MAVSQGTIRVHIGSFLSMRTSTRTPFIHIHQSVPRHARGPGQTHITRLQRVVHAFDSILSSMMTLTTTPPLALMILPPHVMGIRPKVTYPVSARVASQGAISNRVLYLRGGPCRIDPLSTVPHLN